MASEDMGTTWETQFPLTHLMLAPAPRPPSAGHIPLTSAHSWKYTMTMLICEQDTTRMMKTRNRKPKVIELILPDCSDTSEPAFSEPAPAPQPLPVLGNSIPRSGLGREWRTIMTPLGPVVLACAWPGLSSLEQRVSQAVPRRGWAWLILTCVGPSLNSAACGK